MPADTAAPVQKSGAQLLARAEGWRAELERRADEIEKARKLPQDIADRLAADGLYAMCIRLNGAGPGPLRWTM